MTKNTENLMNKLMREKYEPIAIVGIGLRFPSNNVDTDSFAQMLANGQESISPIPENRWNNKKYYHDIKGTTGKICTHSGGYITNFDHFDPAFFSISPKEASNMDPQQRLMLELAWEALENANINPELLSGSNGSVYIGASTIDYHKETLELKEEALVNQMGTGTANSAISGRISYFLGLRGPCLTLDTACSSSLVALHLSIQGLRHQESDIALCGAVSLIHHPSSHIIFSHANMLAPDGRCKTFDSSADGYGRSEGAGLVVLKRLSDAIKDNNNILAILRGSAVLQDGQSGGLTVPNGIAQEQVMRKALENSLLEPMDISYVEAHGTGTPLGDPIEIQAIHQVFGEYFNKTSPLKVGSVKTNVGHMEAAAGMGGLIKVILQIKNKKIYPHLNLKNPSEHIPWHNMSFQIPQKMLDWENNKKRALINSFGFTGTIASLVVEEPPPLKTATHSGISEKILTLSAKNLYSLKELVNRYLIEAQKLKENDVQAFCYTSNIGRAHFSYRLASLIKDKTSLISFLEKTQSQLKNSDIPDNNLYREHKIAFLFTGQGSQYVGMGKKLYEQYPLFREKINECDKLFSTYLNCSIKDIIFGNREKSEEEINQTLYSQPALFTVEYALSQLWMAWGIRPSIVIGHSIGEVVAATIAGVFSLENAIQLVAARARLMQSVRQIGGMVAVQASAEILQPYLKDQETLSFAAINTPQQCVISGERKALELLMLDLTQQEISCKMLKVSHAFHSVHMEEILEEFYNAIKTLAFNEPTLPIISNITGEIAQKEIMTPDYWVQHIRKSVQFLQGISHIDKRGSHIFLEVGPNSVLIALGKQCIKSSPTLWLSSIKPSAENETIQQSVVALYQAGLKINWQAFRHHALEKIHLPLYPFNRKRYWLANAKKSVVTVNHPLLGERKIAENGIWEYLGEASSENPSYLGDHVVMGKIIFPGASYIDMILALQDAVFGKSNLMIKDLHIQKPLFLHETPTSLLTRLTKISDSLYEFEIFSIDSQTITGTNKHVTGKLEKADPADMLVLFKDFPITPASNTPIQYNEEIYEVLLSKGLEYGPSFRKAQWVEKYSPTHVKGSIETHDSSTLTFLHPPLLDAVLHTIDAALHAIDPNKTYLPVGFEKFIFLKKPRNKLESKIFLKLTNENTADAAADLLLLDEGEPVFIAQNLWLKTIFGAVHKKSDKTSLNLFYLPKWLKLNLNDDISTKTSAILIAPPAFWDNTINQYLTSFESLAIANNFQQLEDYLKTNKEIKQLVYFWKSLTTAEADSAQKECEVNYNFILAIFHLLENSYLSRNIKLIFVTKGAQIKAHDNPSILKPHQLLQSSLWGFCTVLNNEYPKYESRIIDFDPTPEFSFSNYKQLIQEIFKSIPGGEFQIAYRRGKRFVRRLCAVNDSDNTNFKLASGEYDTFSNIIQQPIPIEQPYADQILVRVYAAGVNFKDALNALGLLKQHAVKTNTNYVPLPLGFECAGVVIAAGESAQFAVGEAVIISHLGCMQKFITVSSQVAVRKPKNISFAEAAGIATAYITSYHALHNLAQMQSGDKVLIHAAAGGVGQAAIQLAKRVNAEIYATASESKWRFLKNQGIDHIMNSRDLTFGETLYQKTNSHGVDIVLNSLNKEYIPIGLKALSKQGRFVEIGKIDIWDHQQVKELRDDIEYHNFDLSELPAQELNQLNKGILEKIVGYLEAGEIAPLPITVYGLDEVQEAFSTISRGANIGKLIISFIEEESFVSKPLKIKSDRTYLITGGFGALGLYTTKWLVNQGAKHIALLGRTLPSPERLREIAAEINNNTVHLIPLKVDIAQSEDLTETFRHLRHHHPAIAGIIHGAGVLEDAPIHSQKWANLDKVFSPKIYGTWHLHEQALLLQDLDFFISYSSVASLAGSGGQANYAAANAYIDSVMKWRALSGQPGLAINWGPWAEVGMAANLSHSVIQSIEEKGMKFIKPHDALQALSQAASSTLSQCIIGEFNWSKYHSSLAAENKFYANIATKEDQRVSPQIAVIDIISLPLEERLSQIHNIIRNKLAMVLHFDDENEIEWNAKFSDLGLDSLVSVEFKNILEKTFKISLQATLVFDYPSIPLLAEFLLNHFGGDKKKKKSSFSKLLNRFKEHS